jgi:hypothetical protein
VHPDPTPSIDHANPPTHAESGHRSRHVARMSNLPILGGTAFMSRIQQLASRAPASQKFPRLLAFLQVSKWFSLYFYDLFHKKAPYQTYPAGHAGIFRVPPLKNETLRIAAAADWGTGTLEAETVAANMLASDPHYTLHLGDVYYMGDPAEIVENCLGEKTKNFAGVTWPRGSLGSFAIMGNHEMYSGGQGYFQKLLPTLGTFKPDKSVDTPQSASFFALVTDHWIILGLDTGYHSGGLPAFSEIPLLNRIPFFNVDARFDDQMLAWLKQTIATLGAEATQKHFLILTHHQPLSSFEQPFPKPASQLSQAGFLNGRDFIWLYGHEHRLTLYRQQTVAPGLKPYPRCIGHGGMPVDLSELTKPDPKILFYDPRQHPIDHQHPHTKVGYNGHVVLLFRGAALTIEYHDIPNNNLIFTETFTPEADGTLKFTPSVPTPGTLHSTHPPD